jgi:thioesterase domain-containing protein
MLALFDSSVAATGQQQHEASPVDAASMVNFALDLGVTPEQLSLIPEEMLGRAPQEQLACILELAHEAGIITSNVGLPQFEGFLKVYQNNQRAMRNYVPQATRGGRVVLFKAEERQSSGEDATRGWGQMAGGGVEVYTVAGNHFSMLREPHVRALAEQLGNCLSKAGI